MKWKKREAELMRLKHKHGRDKTLVRKYPDLTVEQEVSPTSDYICETKNWKLLGSHKARMFPEKE